MTDLQQKNFLINNKSKFIEGRKVQVDFVEEAKSQAITVHYDSPLTDIAQLKKRIEQTNDGQFTVLNTDKTRKSN